MRKPIKYILTICWISILFSLSLSARPSDLYSISKLFQTEPVNPPVFDSVYPPAAVYAEVMDNDTWCMVDWTLPEGPYEISMDDGDADDYFIYSSGGNINAVKFTPAGYPATVIGGQIYVGDGSYPGPFLGSHFSVAIFDNDGANGLPGTMLDSNAVTVNNYGWVEFDWLNAVVEDGDFYLAMIQTEPGDDSAPIAIDLDDPIFYRSYCNVAGSNAWVLSPLQDFMIRAWVDGPITSCESRPKLKNLKAPPRIPANWQRYGMTSSGTIRKIPPGFENTDRKIKGIPGRSSRDISGYMVARYVNFDPEGPPGSGTFQDFAYTQNLFYNDYAFGAYGAGWIAYGVEVLYTGGEYSGYTISNYVAHLMDVSVIVNVTLSTGFEPGNAEITLQGNDYPHKTYQTTTNADGTAVFDSVYKGLYNMTVHKSGYEDYFVENVPVYSDTVSDVTLGEKRYPPAALYVDPLTLQASWHKPLRTAVDEDFEDPGFPPPGWQSLTSSTAFGWFRSNNGSSEGFMIPPWDGYYAVSNNDAGQSDYNGCCDYLITPPLDLRETGGFVLNFDSFYTGAYGELAFVEYSFDDGITWEVMFQVQPDDYWTNIDFDLSSFSGEQGQPEIWIAFHADDAGQWASGWAIDNVKIQIPAPAADYLDFWVYLDDTYLGTTTDTVWDFVPMEFGQPHTAAVAARYTSGMSQPDTCSFTTTFLFPPDSLRGSAPDQDALLSWDPPSEYWPISNGSRDVGEVISSFIAPGPINSCWGICDDGENLWITDPSVSNNKIFQVTYNGTNTGVSITVEEGQSWIGDMVSDGEFLYGCLVGGPNTIVKVDLATGETVETISGGWTASSQTGLTADFVNEEFYIGGNISNRIWRTTFDGMTISTTNYNNVSGLAWTPVGGPDQEGSLWVVENSSQDLVSEVLPNENWVTIQAFVLPGGQQYSGAGAELKLTVPYMGALWIANQSDNTIYVVDIEEWFSCCLPQILPDNLLGYNIYRDSGFVAYTPHTPIGSWVTQQYLDTNLLPGIYQYSVSGVYDLEPYGFPGDSAESLLEGPAEVAVDYCSDLDFLETWNLGTFTANHWEVRGENWNINSHEGNPAPAAEFTWDPIQNNYEMSLESYPMCAQNMTDGIIWLDFDIKLDAVNPTGEEKMLVQIWAWDDQQWATIMIYSNTNGSFNWESKRLDIRSKTLGKVFKIRFLACGVNSLDIVSWFVDNIHVYRTCNVPSDLSATAVFFNQAGILLNWIGPDFDGIDEWIHWDDGNNSGNSIGTGAAVEFDVAARWEPGQLEDYEGASLVEVAFFPAESACNYNVRVWIGAGAADLVVDQPVPYPVIGQWNFIALLTPVLVNSDQDLWVGYYVDSQTGYPAGVDDGPAADGYGNMINFGGWQTLLQVNPDLDYNWNIEAHLMNLAGDKVPLSRELTGFNIYRSWDGGDYSFLDFTATDEYLDTDDDLILQSIYCYKVKALFTSETDFCESDYSNEACEVWHESVPDLDSGGRNLKIYPNPADDRVFISTSGDLKRVTVYNALGWKVAEEITSGKQVELVTANYTTGVYMVHIETDAGVNTRTLTIQR
jgi:hypothetical protein